MDYHGLRQVWSGPKGVSFHAVRSDASRVSAQLGQMEAPLYCKPKPHYSGGSRISSPRWHCGATGDFAKISFGLARRRWAAPSPVQ